MSLSLNAWILFPTARLYLNGREGLSIRTCIVNVPAESTRIKEIESSFELKQKQDAKRSDPLLDTRFKLKRERLQKKKKIQSNTTKARTTKPNPQDHTIFFLLI